MRDFTASKVATDTLMSSSEKLRADYPSVCNLIREAVAKSIAGVRIWVNKYSAEDKELQDLLWSLGYNVFPVSEVRDAGGRDEEILIYWGHLLRPPTDRPAMP